MVACSPAALLATPARDAVGSNDVEVEGVGVGRTGSGVGVLLGVPAGFGFHIVSD